MSFDSILNVSSHAFGFGSPDIVPMFRDGADEGRVDMWCYGAEVEDFSAEPSAVDTWVLDRVLELFANATADAALDAQLRAPRTVFFLHLLGLDTCGHAHRPHGPEYYRSIQVNDAIVRRVVERFETFYGDERTAFVYTADHGMSNIGARSLCARADTAGNHGDGDPDNTRTPIVAWGAGVAAPRPLDEYGDEQAAAWGLSSHSSPVEQVDIAPLMVRSRIATALTRQATLIGADIPANSEGILPLYYLDAPVEYKAQAAAANIRSIYAQYEALQGASTPR